MRRKIKKTYSCTDGRERTPREYNAWIKELAKLYLIEPGDLTKEELKALENEGVI